MPDITAGANKHTVEDFVITRVFDASRDLVFKTWTEADHLSKWMGPTGTTSIGSKIDLRPGGIYHYGLRTADGVEMLGKWVIREIKAPERLVYIQSFCDKDGGMARHPFVPTWPKELLSTVEFIEKDGKTTVTLRWAPYNSEEEEINTFEAGRDGMTQGWGGAFEKLVAHLKEFKNKG